MLGHAATRTSSSKATGYSFGDVVLVPFPFTDQSATKKGPTVAVKSDAYDTRRPDIVLKAITGQLAPRLAFGC